MFSSSNPENEIRRAQSMLRSFTEQKEAVNLFEDDQNYNRFESAPRGKRSTQALKAVKPNRQTSEQLAFASQQVCCP